jgi:hypothetical protein
LRFLDIREQYGLAHEKQDIQFVGNYSHQNAPTTLITALDGSLRSRVVACDDSTEAKRSNQCDVAGGGCALYVRSGLSLLEQVHLNEDAICVDESYGTYLLETENARERRALCC